METNKQTEYQNTLKGLADIFGVKLVDGKLVSYQADGTTENK